MQGKKCVLIYSEKVNLHTHTHTHTHTRKEREWQMQVKGLLVFIILVSQLSYRFKTFQNKKLWWVKQPERRVKERNLSQKFSWTPEKMVAAVNEITSPYVSQRVSEKKQEMNNSSYCFTIVVDHQEWETQKDVRRVDNKFSL